MARLWGVPTCRPKPGKTAVEMFDAIAPRRDQGGVDRLHQSGAVDARRDARARSARARRVRGRAGGLPQHRYRRATPTCCCRRRPGAKRKARSPIPSGASRACARRCRRPAKRAPTGRSPPISRCGSARALGDARAAHCFRTRRPRQIFNEHRESTRGRDLDITGLSYALLESRRTAAMAASGRRQTGAARLYADGRFRDADGRARFAARQYVARRPRRSMRAIRCAQHRAPARPMARHEPHRPRRAPVQPRRASRGSR